jgi:DNA-directed RNA polymerase subunit N (RpoN/RPB10)
MFTCQKAKSESIIQAEIHFDKGFKFNLKDIPESSYVNEVIKRRLELSLKDPKTIPEHIEYVNRWVEETLKLQNNKTTLDELGINHHNFRKQLVTLFQTVSVASIH